MMWIFTLFHLSSVDKLSKSISLNKLDFRSDNQQLWIVESLQLFNTLSKLRKSVINDQVHCFHWKLLNSRNEQTFITTNRSEILDITLCAAPLVPFVRVCKVTKEALISDYRCIRFFLDLDPMPPILFRNLASTNWSYCVDTLCDDLNKTEGRYS